MVKKTKAIIEDVSKDYSKYFRKLDHELPKQVKRSGSGKYFGIVSAILREPKGTYEIQLNLLNLPMKSVYPSIEKVLMQIAKKDNVDFTVKETKTVPTVKGDRTYTSYPKYKEWKEKNVRLRTSESQIYIEKLNDRTF